MKITVLLENTINRENKENKLVAEHGLSLYIELENTRILFDMGQTDAFLANAQKLGIDLGKTDYAVISHGHYDHGGGLEAFLKETAQIPIYLQTTAFESYYNAQKKYIGLDKKLICENHQKERFYFVDDYVKIAEGIELFSCNEKKRLFPHTSNNLFSEKEKVFTEDVFCHELYLLLTENEKRVLISGCAHKGIANLVEWFKPDVVVGGFHLKGLSCDDKEQCNSIKILAEKLCSYGIPYYTCHCTGEEQFALLQKTMKSSVTYCYCGKEIIL